jgi:hypothetical protein
MMNSSLLQTLHLEKGFKLCGELVRTQKYGQFEKNKTKKYLSVRLGRFKMNSVQWMHIDERQKHI